MSPLTFWAIVTLTFATAFGCVRCQDINKPKNLVNIEQLQKEIRETPVTVVYQDTVRLFLIPHAQEYYQAWYFLVVGCSGLRADSTWKQLKFYVADHPLLPIDDTTSAYGYYSNSTHSIVLGLSGVWERKVVSHEILHMLLWQAGIEDSTTIDPHPKVYYEDKCHGFVTPH